MEYKMLQGLNFAQRTEASEYNIHPIIRGSEYNANRRREGLADWRTGRMEFSTENKENFRENKVNKIARVRATSNIGFFDDKLDNVTESRDAYKAKYGRRAITTGKVMLTSEQTNWTPSPQTSLRTQETLSPKISRSRSGGGMFALTTETSAR